MNKELRKAAEKLLDRYVKLVNSEDDLEVAALRQALEATEQSEPERVPMIRRKGQDTWITCRPEEFAEYCSVPRLTRLFETRVLYTHPPALSDSEKLPKHAPLSDEQVNGFAHELWALARKMPNEGIEDCVHRIAEGVKAVEKAVKGGE